MNNTTPNNQELQDYDSFHIVVESRYEKDKSIIVCITPELKSFDDAKCCLANLKNDFPTARIRAERFY